MSTTHLTPVPTPKRASNTDSPKPSLWSTLKTRIQAATSKCRSSAKNLAAKLLGKTKKKKSDDAGGAKKKAGQSSHTQGFFVQRKHVISWLDGTSQTSTAPRHYTPAGSPEEYEPLLGDLRMTN